MLGLGKIATTLKERTPLGLLQLKHDPMRLLTAIAGITFADILIFMQLGFADALYRTNTRFPRMLQADLVITSTEAENFNQPETFSRRRLYQAQDVPGVAAADALYIGSVRWRNPQTRERTSLLVMGQNPDRAVFDLPEVTQQIESTRLPYTVLFDRASRGNYEEAIARVEAGETVTAEIGTHTVTISGLFEVGASFADDGALITSDQNFLRLFPRREAGAVSIGLVHLEPGADPDSVREALEARLPDDVKVFTSQGYVDSEVAFIQSNSAIGFVFSVGTAIGFKSRVL